ncbi:hypothetical protein B4Q04_09335 [Zobellia sp. OII3]|uniref:phage tail protein n=1 Tax=Zobellia sp. OII3 TaxID=2034520 RepID=UPI000B52E061|nr:hypothetical protein [Zobellia sp. OII3]OWW25788.1 hypothetical protein B4Q04_09335 [Zobellia sp. OII3]
MACRSVSTWITEKILTPVSRFITEAKEVCENIGQWVEEQVNQPIEEWVSQEERKCKRQKCKWWCACCNKWFCWIVVVVVKVVTWVVVTVTKWVVTLVCQIVTHVIGIVIELVLKIIHRLVTFLVCLFTDPLQAFKTLWDLWNDIVDTIEDIIDFIGVLLQDLKGMLSDIGRLLEGLGRTFCIFGKVLCSIFTAIFGFFSGIFAWLEDIVDILADTLEGLKDLIVGLLTFNWCKIQGGLGILNIFRLIPSVTRLLGQVFYVGPKGLVEKAKIENIIETALEEVFSDDPERLERSKRKARLGGDPIGVPLTIDPRRLAIRSSDFLKRLHDEGILNLHALAGRVSNCSGKFIYSAFDGEVVYTGTSTKVSQSDLDDFISLGPNSVPSFTAYPIKKATFKRYLDLARRKGFQIGLNFTWPSIKDLVVSSLQHVPLQSDTADDTAQRELFALMGRPVENEDLSTVPTVAVFGYRDLSLNGLTSWYRPELAEFSPSGVTFRTRFPEVALRFVPIHEIGHYYGLNHEDHDNPALIMWTPKEGGGIVKAIPEYLLLSGEANFTLDDAEATWNYITTTQQARDSILP